MNSFVIDPAAVIRPIRLGPVSVYQSAPSEPVAIPEGSPLPAANSVIAPVVLMRPILLPANSVNHNAPPVAVIPDGSLSGVGIGKSMNPPPVVIAPTAFAAPSV